jgi:hypothetical protein
MTLLTPARMLRAIKKTPLILESILRDVTPEQAQTLTDGPDGWSTVEIMCHLRDFEQIFYGRAVKMLDYDRPTFESIDQNKLVREGNYREQNLHQAFEYYRATRQEFVTLLEGLNDEHWHRTGISPSSGEYDLLQLAMQVALHDVDHTEQVIRILGK